MIRLPMILLPAFFLLGARAARAARDMPSTGISRESNASTCRTILAERLELHAHAHPVSVAHEAHLHDLAHLVLIERVRQLIE